MKTKSNWISVKDKLPANGVEILFYVQYVGIRHGSYDSRLTRFTQNHEDVSGREVEVDDYLSVCEYQYPYEYRVTHWMPLPEPPKPEGEE